MEPCGVGTYANMTESEFCTDCEEGKYQNEKGKDDCKKCGPGKFCRKGAAEQLDCFPGTWSEMEGLDDYSQCKNCSLGMFCAKGSVVQTPCPAGTVGETTNLVSQQSCKPCVDNTWSNPGSSSCDSCQKDYFLPPQLEKKTTYVGTASVECLLCLDNAKCLANVTLETIDLDDQWWRLGPRSKELHKCDQNVQTKFTPCRGGNQSGVDGSDYCHEGYEGPLCRLCTDDTEWYNPQSSECEECPEPANTIGQLVGMVSGVLVLLTALVLAIKYASKRSSHVMRARNGLVLCLRRMHHLSTAVSLVPKLKLVLAFYQSAAVRKNMAACPCPRSIC